MEVGSGKGSIALWNLCVGGNSCILNLGIVRASEIEKDKASFQDMLPWC